jgi:hypothetical protein
VKYASVWRGPVGSRAQYEEIEMNVITNVTNRCEMRDLSDQELSYVVGGDWANLIGGYVDAFVEGMREAFRDRYGG